MKKNKDTKLQASVSPIGSTDPILLGLSLKERKETGIEMAQKVTDMFRTEDSSR